MSALAVSHVYPLGARLNERGRLEVGGCDVLELAAEFGTPAYVYAEDDMRARARSFIEAFRARTEHFEVVYASKAFPCTAAYRLFAEEGLSADVASGGELHLALEAGMDPERLYMHGNNKSPPSSITRSRAASATSWSTRSTRSSACAAAGPARAAAGHAGHRAHHARVHPDRARSTRSSASRWTRWTGRSGVR